MASGAIGRRFESCRAHEAEGVEGKPDGHPWVRAVGTRVLASGICVGVR